MLSVAVLMLTITTPGIAQDVPDFGSAKTLPYPYTDFEITDDGYLIEEGDMVRSCKDLNFSDYDFSEYDSYAPEAQARIRESYKREYNALVKACTKAGFPPDGALPHTGGPSFILVSAALLVGGASSPRVGR